MSIYSKTQKPLISNTAMQGKIVEMHPRWHQEIPVLITTVTSLTYLSKHFLLYTARLKSRV